VCQPEYLLFIYYRQIALSMRHSRAR
jgi:hypothetical protein